MKQDVWVLLDSAPGESREAPSWALVYSSREEALRSLREDYLGEDAAAAVRWHPSPSNPDFWDGTDGDGTRLRLYRWTVDEL